ncbi:MAG: hypothetical protein COV32_01795 [Candidatus Yonathbacteria bacterium CG10_big_fil_rev_8_21_14_0_10_43_136]|uniref:Transmembrane protein n=2 Tax=Parcubacteria group TaxID=1794811 RepID=A0A2M7Q5A2_9BACT|nr:MAG: hypothetical protein AUK15_01830 [Candidatus Nomurabacteria bacterium CG2_30_43_9]PIQ35941.1 MAG: hypothetical protein COW60_01205 [Candidatus Yonathbacteria bacterium CG17_big_fil_post_rev_8_21_14_2_50_43_9]PIR40734.1 MAG: hypothetical protein COV32_01795 [Candidatus Yonathbacteria bacterium CG10_big_fil_rev_8_21_14_0_10_43_136]PIX57318.1 MAG: hypothetical protein COZ48_01260 [Candidatus Yonathbacteria bacterium CG_4_10_14_3_um_filter_43_12]PIY58573.1 MAG: hypothetical protein COY98_01
MGITIIPPFAQNINREKYCFTRFFSTSKRAGLLFSVFLPPSEASRFLVPCASATARAEQIFSKKLCVQQKRSLPSDLYFFALFFGFFFSLCASLPFAMVDFK